MSQILSEIKSLYLCRETQINQLYELICHSVHWPTVLVFGSRGTAKSGVVHTLVDKLNVFNAFINCLEFFNNKIIFDNILHQLMTKNETINGFVCDSNAIKCNSALDFILNLKPILQQFVDKSNQNKRQILRKCFIVFDSSEYLFNTNNSELIKTFTNLEELTDNVCPITCLFISRQSLDWFCRISSYPLSVIQIHFTNYTSDEMSIILSNDCPIHYSKEFYMNYVNIILKTLTQFTRNFTEIRNFCLSNFNKYCEPINTQEMTAKDSAKLYKRFQPILLEIIDEIPLKVVNRSSESFELTNCVKYLLIASYLCSYNSVKTDKKFFVKYIGNKAQRKRRVNVVKEEKECNGPKSFTFERMLHIYKSILQLNAENSDDELLLNLPSNKLFSQIEELVSLKLIHKIYLSNKNNCLSSLSKYQISNSVTFEFIKELAIKLNFNINSYLE